MTRAIRQRLIGNALKVNKRKRSRRGDARNVARRPGSRSEVTSVRHAVKHSNFIAFIIHIENMAMDGQFNFYFNQQLFIVHMLIAREEIFQMRVLHTCDCREMPGDRFSPRSVRTDKDSGETRACLATQDISRISQGSSRALRIIKLELCVRPCENLQHVHSKLRWPLSSVDRASAS